MKIGIFGGTFDPPHVGHLIVADEVRSELALDAILFIPAKRSPHKLDRKPASAVKRLKLLSLATRDTPHFIVSDLELRRGGISYTVDTLEKLHKKNPKDEFFLIIGMDNLRSFHTWRSPEKIIGLATVVVMTRAGVPRIRVPHALKKKTILCPVPEIGVSSSDIRKRIREGKAFRHLVSPPVYAFIKRHRMYV